MYKRIAFAVLMVSVIGCTELKDRFGTGEETPELKAAREACRSVADSAAANEKLNAIQQKEQSRLAYDKCMEGKGYDRYGKKVN